MTSHTDAVDGPLSGIRVVEMGGIGPGPHAAMMLADLGADIARIERPSANLANGASDPDQDAMLRHRRRLVVDVKDPEQHARLRRLIVGADVFIDVSRPGAMERLGLGPDECCRDNLRLVYARMSGWGQGGPWAQRPAHDINVVAVSGVLSVIRDDSGKPVVPLNLVSDYGGGSMYLVVGILAALLERERSGRGQVVDAAMIDGVVNLSQAVWNRRASGNWVDEPRGNIVDGGAPFNDVYECADGRYIAVGALEPHLYDAWLRGLGLEAQDLPERWDRNNWPAIRANFAERIRSQPREYWEQIFDAVDACVTPVLSLDEAQVHPHLRFREVLVGVDGHGVAAPAPRFSRSRSRNPDRPSREVDYIERVIQEWETV